MVETLNLDPHLLQQKLFQLVVVEEGVETEVLHMLVPMVVPVVVEVNPQHHMEVRQLLVAQETHHHNHHHKEIMVEEEIILRVETPLLVVEEEVLALLDKPQHQVPVEMVVLDHQLRSKLQLLNFMLVAEEEELVLQRTQNQMLEPQDLVDQVEEEMDQEHRKLLLVHL
tara:strand:+ start:28 stop:534 length:507 start_codon:yes stop_codon:yes gene_type:complete